jgi:hypothetical protein
MDDALTALAEHLPVGFAIIITVGMFLRWICRELQELRRSIDKVADRLLDLAEKVAEQRRTG